MACPLVLEPPKVVRNEVPGPSATSQAIVWKMHCCAFRANDVPVLTFGTLDNHNAMVVRAFREHVRSTLVALGDLACEGQRVLGLVWLLCLGRIRRALREVSRVRRCVCRRVGIEPLAQVDE
jgi:hypothetical protein